MEVASREKSDAALEAANLKLVRTHYAAYASADVDGVLATLSPDVELYVNDEHGKPELPPIRGLESAREFFEHIFSKVTHSTTEIESMRADGDRVLISLSLGGTMRETGQTGAIPAIHLFSVHDGLITAIRTHRPDWQDHAD